MQKPSTQQQKQHLKPPTGHLLVLPLPSLTGKTDAGKVKQEEKGTTEDEMVEWDHRLNGHEFKQTQEDNEG